MSFDTCYYAATQSQRLPYPPRANEGANENELPTEKHHTQWQLRLRSRNLVSPAKKIKKEEENEVL
jgi:hypothetical protein